MTPEHAKQLLPIITAFAEGKAVQYKPEAGEWEDCINPTFSMPMHKYRIRPEPREWFANIYLSGSGYLHETENDSASARGNSKAETIRVREIIED